MSTVMQSDSASSHWLDRVLLVLLLGIAGFFLWTEHRAHLFGALPWFLLTICLAIFVWAWFVDLYHSRQMRGAIEGHLRRGQGGRSHDA
jgi:hypothetical protein